MTLTPPEQLRGALHDWYHTVRRDLPWRGTRDAYAIWVSEIMLQQTRVEVVIPYYARFLERFPTLAALAEASEDEVLGLWAGLGYYERARRLHRAARQLSAAGGELPRTAAELESLPGIGAYTAAAIASIAYDEATPVLDGNVERVLARLLALEEDPRKAASRRRLLEAATALLDRRRPGESNQAVMELGATVCRPRQPECWRCPLRDGCRGLAAGAPERFPVPRKRSRPLRVRRRVGVARRRGRVLLFRRPAASRQLAGLWELPWIELREGERARGRSFARRYGGSWRLRPVRGRVSHTITGRRLEVEVSEAEFSGTGSVAEGPEAGWFDVDELAGLPTSSLVGKALRRIEPRPA